MQSLHRRHDENSLPGPPSSQSPSEEKLHVSTHDPGAGGGGDGDGGGGDNRWPHIDRAPQSKQSVHRAHRSYSAPAPPSSQSPSEAKGHVLPQAPMGGGGGGDGSGGGGGDGDADAMKSQRLARNRSVSCAMVGPTNAWVTAGSDAMAFSVDTLTLEPYPRANSLIPADLRVAAAVMAAALPPYGELCCPSVNNIAIFKYSGPRSSKAGIASFRPALMLVAP